MLFYHSPIFLFINDLVRLKMGCFDHYKDSAGTSSPTRCFRRHQRASFRRSCACFAGPGRRLPKLISRYAGAVEPVSKLCNRRFRGREISRRRFQHCPETRKHVRKYFGATHNWHSRATGDRSYEILLDAEELSPGQSCCNGRGYTA
jgi:hypothetical protein